MTRYTTTAHNIHLAHAKALQATEATPKPVTIYIKGFGPFCTVIPPAKGGKDVCASPDPY